MSKWGHSKVRSEHVSRKAVVYLRQSSMKQVRENLESQRLQYASAAPPPQWLTGTLISLS